MSQQFEEEDVEILEEQLINFLKEKYNVIPTPKNPLCCDDITRQDFIEKSNYDINIYKKLLINFYSERIDNPVIIRDLTNFLFPEEYLPLVSSKDKRKINDGINITVRKDKNNAGPAKKNKSVFNSYKAEDFQFGGRRKSKRRKSKRRRNSRKRRRCTKRRR